MEVQSFYEGEPASTIMEVQRPYIEELVSWSWKNYEVQELLKKDFDGIRR